MRTKIRILYLLLMSSNLIFLIGGLLYCVIPYHHHAQIGGIVALLGIFLVTYLILTEFVILIFDEDLQNITVYTLIKFSKKQYSYIDIYGIYFESFESKGILSKGLVFYLMDGNLLKINDKSTRNFDEVETFSLKRFDLISSTKYNILYNNDKDNVISERFIFNYSQAKNNRFWMIISFVFILIFNILSISLLSDKTRLDSKMDIPLFVITTISLILIVKKIIVVQLKINKIEAENK